MEIQMNKPQIRFNECTDAWSKQRLKEIGSTFTGLSGKTKKDFGHGKANFITYMNVLNHQITSLKEIEPVEIDKKQNEVKYGDIFFTTSSETPEEVGMSSLWMGNKKNIYLNSFCFGYRLKRKTDLYYMAYMLRSKPFRKKITVLAQGISRYNISKNAVMNIEVNLPTIKEQHKIGSLLNHLEKTIDLHTQKYNKLLYIRKSMLEKMFPKKEKNTPEIRFKEFKKIWKKYKLEDYAFYRRGSFPQPYGKKEWYDGKNAMPFVQVADVTDKMNLATKTKQKISELAKPMSIFVPKNSVIVTLQGSIGRVAITQYDSYLDRTVLYFKGYKTKTNITFFGYIIKNKFEEEAKSAPGGTIKTITKEVLSDFILKIPDFEEQEKIGTFLHTLDDLITLYENKIEKLKSIQNILLEKMFL